MERISKAIAKHSKIILLTAIILLVPSVFGFIKTDVNILIIEGILYATAYNPFNEAPYQYATI